MPRLRISPLAVELMDSEALSQFICSKVGESYYWVNTWAEAKHCLPAGLSYGLFAPGQCLLSTLQVICQPYLLLAAQHMEVQLSTVQGGDSIAAHMLRRAGTDAYASGV